MRHDPRSVVFGLGSARLALLAGVVLWLPGCAGADVTGLPLENGDFGRGTGELGSPTCEAPARPPLGDPATLPDCSPACAGAHCVPADKLGPDIAKQLAACPGGFCVPDALIVSGGAAPPACVDLLGAPGACLSTCVPRVGELKDVLKQGSCQAGERCASCNDATNHNVSTGACEIGKSGGQCAGGVDLGTADGGGPTCPHVGAPVLNPSDYPSCYAGNSAHCLPLGAIDPMLATRLQPCGTAGRCVPDPFISSGGNFIPQTCSSLAGAEGRCLHVVLPSVHDKESTLPVDHCQSYERCVPCYDPLDGAVTGACSISCDPGPAQAPVRFADCCKSASRPPRGRCLPKIAIPMSQQSNLGTDTCKVDAELCVPDENLDPKFTPTACKANSAVFGDYKGVCLSTCLSLGIIGLGVARGDCDDVHQCVPCTIVIFPSGAPGCS